MRVISLVFGVIATIASTACISIPHYNTKARTIDYEGFFKVDPDGRESFAFRSREKAQQIRDVSPGDHCIRFKDAGMREQVFSKLAPMPADAGLMVFVRIRAYVDIDFSGDRCRRLLQVEELIGIEGF